MKIEIKYNDVIKLENIMYIYNRLRYSSKHKRKIISFDMFYLENIFNLYEDLLNKTYKHLEYNIFTIKEPKERLIMSEKLKDKIVDQLFSTFALSPILEKKFVVENVATRKGFGSRAANNLIKKYIKKLKFKGKKVYALKMDIHKYFQSINHKMLKELLSHDIDDKDIYNFISNLIDSTNIGKSSKYYNKGYGLPIGNMSSQILAIYYLSGLDHYIKEVLHEKYICRYMDDIIIFSNDKDRLKRDLKLIEEYLKSLDLHLNSKTSINDLKRGVNFLGYRYILKDKRLIIALKKRTRMRLIRRIRNGKSTIENYNGYTIFSNINISSKIMNKSSNTSNN